MTAQFVLPTLIAVVLVCSMGLVDWRLHPRVALPVFSAAMFIAAAGLLVVLTGAATGFALGPARSSSVLAWCRIIPLHHQVHPVAGIGALSALALVGWRVAQVLRARRQAIGSVEADARISIIDDEDPIAHAVPTRTGCVVVSTGLLSLLTPSERRAVFAHERAHLQLGHHRYVLLAELCVAALPLVRPLAYQLRHATERAADEAAASHVDNRTIVARAIGAVALGPGLTGVPGWGGGSIPRRVEALLWPEREGLASKHISTLSATITVAAAVAVAVQLHHFGELVNHLCNSTS